MGTWFTSVLCVKEAEVKGDTDENKDKGGRKERGNGKGGSCKNMCIRRRGDKPSCQLCSLEAMAEHGKDDIAGKMATAVIFAKDVLEYHRQVPHCPCLMKETSLLCFAAGTRGQNTLGMMRHTDISWRGFGERGWKGEVCISRNDD